MPRRELKEVIEAEGRRLECALDVTQSERLAEFFALLARWGQRIRLTGSRDPEQLVLQHLADALQMWREVGAVRSFIDVGSGGGLPAIPYLLLQPPAPALLVEVNQRKAAFLRTAAHDAGLRMCDVRACRVEELGDDVDEFALASSRATFAPPSWLEKAQPLVAPGGRVLVFAARDEQLPGVVGRLRAGELWRYVLVDGAPRVLACYHR